MSSSKQTKDYAFRQAKNINKLIKKLQKGKDVSIEDLYSRIASLHAKMKDEVKGQKKEAFFFELHYSKLLAEQADEIHSEWDKDPSAKFEFYETISLLEHRARQLLNISKQTEHDDLDTEKEIISPLRAKKKVKLTHASPIHQAESTVGQVSRLLPPVGVGEDYIVEDEQRPPSPPAIETLRQARGQLPTQDQVMLEEEFANERESDDEADEDYMP